MIELATTLPPFTVDEVHIILQLFPPLIWETNFRPPEKKKGEEWRVLVTEYERHMVDDDRSPRDQDAPDPALRLVYAEAFAL